MVRRWLLPIAFGLILAAVTYQVVMVQTPRFLMSGAIRRLAGAGGTNAFFHGPLATADSRTIVKPSPDLAYSSCPFDLSKGPVLIDAMPVPASYWSLSVFDARTDAVFVRNNLQAGGKPIRIALIGGKGGQAPPGYEPVPVKGGKGIALIRILVGDRAAFDAIDAARKASTCKPLTPP